MTSPEPLPVIRPARLDDLEQVLALYQQLLSDDAPPPPRAELEALWARIVSEQQPLTFVAELDGALVASCVLAVILNLTRGGRPYGLIENVVTDQAHRCRGYGTAVLHHAVAHAWRQNCYKVMLSTSSTREATLRFYEQAGFERGVKTGFVVYAPDHTG